MTAKQRELRAALRAAEAAGEDPVRPLYKAMSPGAKRLFVERHAE